MRDPDDLPNVLKSLLEHPGLRNLLKQPKALATYLDKQAWPPLTPEEEEDGPWGRGSLSPDSQESAEAAELWPSVEQLMADLELTPPEKQTLKAALVQTCPECLEMMQIFMPTFARA